MVTFAQAWKVCIFPPSVSSFFIQSGGGVGGSCLTPCSFELRILQNICHFLFNLCIAMAVALDIDRGEYFQTALEGLQLKNSTETEDRRRTYHFPPCVLAHRSSFLSFFVFSPPNLLCFPLYLSSSSYFSSPNTRWLKGSYRHKLPCSFDWTLSPLIVWHRPGSLELRQLGSLKVRLDD